MELVASSLLYLTHLARLERAGVPLPEALAALAATAPDRRLRRAADDVRAGVAAGRPLSDCLAAHPRLFPARAVALVAHGEATGGLAPALAATVESATVLRRIRDAARADLLYLTVVAVAFVVVALGLALAYPLFDTANAERILPWDTESHGLPALVEVVALGTALFLLGAWVVRLLAGVDLGPRLERLRLAFPYYGENLRLSVLAPFVHQVGLLLAAGAPEDRALGTALPLLARGPLRRAATAARGAVSAGTPLAEALLGSGLFEGPDRPLAREALGRPALGEGLRDLGMALFGRLERRARTFALGAGPVLVVVVGAGIAALLYRAVFGMASW